MTQTEMCGSGNSRHWLEICTFTLRPVSFTVVRGGPLMPHEMPKGSKFFPKSTSGLNSGLVVRNRAYSQLISSLLTSVESPTDQRGKWRSRKPGLGSGTRADNGRFFQRVYQKFGLGEFQ